MPTRWIAVAIAALCCALPARADQSRAPAPPERRAEGIGGLALPAGITWKWDAALEDRPRGELAGPDGSRIVFSARTQISHIRRIGPRRAVVWSYAIPGMQPLDAVLLLDGDTLYTALYRGGVSGCRVIALDARSGALRWDTRLVGVGPIGQSAYKTRVEIELALAGLVIYGKESKGRYIEVLRPADGRQIGHRFLGP